MAAKDHRSMETTGDHWQKTVDHLKLPQITESERRLQITLQYRRSLTEDRRSLATDMLSCFHLILEHNGQTDRRTNLLYQYRASVCWHAIKTRMIRLACGEKKIISEAVCIEYRNATDGQTELLYQYRMLVCWCTRKTEGIGISLFAWILSECLSKKINEICAFNNKYF